MDCGFARPQYGGVGGNGYMYRIHSSGENLQHNLTAAHSVFWNITGLGAYGPAVRTEQSRYGYVIGTGGTRTRVALTRIGGDKCDQPDHIEGEGRATTLAPTSLYLDQVVRRRASFPSGGQEPSL